MHVEDETPEAGQRTTQELWTEWFPRAHTGRELFGFQNQRVLTDYAGHSAETPKGPHLSCTAKPSWGEKKILKTT